MRCSKKNAQSRAAGSSRSRSCRNRRSRKRPERAARYRRGVRGGPDNEALGSPPEIVELDDVEGIRIEAVAPNPLRRRGRVGPLLARVIRRCRTSRGARLSVASGTAPSSTSLAMAEASRRTFLADHVDVPAELSAAAPDGTDPLSALLRESRGLPRGFRLRGRRRSARAIASLVPWATGAVGVIAIQAAELLGATMVVGASRSGRVGGTVPLDRLEGVFGAEGFTVCIDPIWGRAARPRARARRAPRADRPPRPGRGC